MPRPTDEIVPQKLRPIYDEIIRFLPREIQEAAYRRGLIPYIPATTPAK
jgi:hypothetical protein